MQFMPNTHLAGAATESGCSLRAGAGCQTKESCPVVFADTWVQCHLDNFLCHVGRLAAQPW